jgi:serine/threonine protein kinase
MHVNAAATLSPARVARLFALARQSHPTSVCGVGGFGEVIRVDERHAVKRSTRTKLDGIAAEFNTMRAIGNHPNIVRVYAYDKWRGREMMLMEMIEGCRDACDYMSDNANVLAESDVLRIVKAVGGALQYVHARGFVHGDVKLDNILVTSTSVKLCDFGSAFRPPAVVASMGTDGYHTPEFVRGQPLTCAVDTWALAVVLFVMLFDQFPFATDDQILSCRTTLATRLRLVTTVDNSPLVSRYRHLFRNIFHIVVARRLTLDAMLLALTT